MTDSITYLSDCLPCDYSGFSSVICIDLISFQEDAEVDVRHGISLLEAGKVMSMIRTQSEYTRRNI
jgi:hypothetical protein